MFILIILILGSSSLKIDVCTVMSILDMPCDQECIETHSPNNEEIAYFNQCLSSYPNLTICLIYTSIMIQSCLQSFSPCFSEENLKNIEEVISLVKSQDECISYFTISTLVNFSKNDNYFVNTENYILENTDIDDCKIKTLMLGNRLAQYAFENKENRYVKSSIKLLLKEHGQFINIEETNKNNEYLNSCKKSSFQNENENFSFNKFTLGILDILEKGEFAYCTIIRLLDIVPLPQLKILLPEIVFTKLQNALNFASKMVGTHSYICSDNINSARDIVMLIKLLNELLGYGSFTYSTIFSIGNYFYQRWE